MTRFVLPLAFLAACSFSTPSDPAPSPSTVSSADSGNQPPFDFEIVAELDVPPGNIAIARDGTPLITLHQFFEPDYQVAMVRNSSVQRILGKVDLVSTLGIVVDDAGTVWVLDNALTTGATPRLVARGNNGVIRDYDLSAATIKGSFVNDFVIDLAKRSAYIADPANGSDAALIVLNLVTGHARRLLEGHESVIPDESLDLVIDEVPVTMKQKDEYVRPKIGVNPIAADATKEWLYFGPMHSNQMYRIRTSSLRDPSLGPVQLRNQIERFASRPICDGIVIDDDGNLYLGDLANNAIGVIRPDGEYEELVRDPRLSWVDAFAVGPDNMVYAVANQLQRSPVLNRGVNGAVAPFLVLKFAPIGALRTERFNPSPKSELARSDQQ